MNDIKDLCRAVEQKTGRTLLTPSDFKWLSEQIEEQTNELLSVSTLMRLWGYRPGVSPRKSTLDILARYLGYADCVAFGIMPTDEEKTRKGTAGLGSTTEEKVPQPVPEEGRTIPEPNMPRQTQFRWRLWMSILLIGLLALGGVFFLHSREKGPKRITSLNQLSNYKQYIIRTHNDVRGALGVKNRVLCTTFESARRHRTDSISTFAIIRHDSLYYLYSVRDHRFFNTILTETDAPLSGTMFGSAMNIRVRDGLFVFNFPSKEITITLNVDEEHGTILADYGTANNIFDEGNQFVLEEVGDFDPTEALNMMTEPNQEYEAAMNSIQPEAQYVIYAESAADSRHYYLHASGKLTDDITDSCIFTFHRIENDSLYRSPSFRVCYHDGACRNGFTYVPAYVEDAPFHRSHIDVMPYFSDLWHGQAFFLGKNGCYAIRCTDAPFEEYTVGAYWTAIDTDGQGHLTIDYSLERAYIWHLAKQ